MSTSGRQNALAHLRACRKQIERELARVERKIARAQSQVLALQERIVSLTTSHRSAA